METQTCASPVPLLQSSRGAAIVMGRSYGTAERASDFPWSRGAEEEGGDGQAQERS